MFNFLLLFQLLAHVSTIFMIYYGSWYHYVCAIFVYFLTGCFGITVTYHRLLSHKSFLPINYFEKVGTLLGTIGGVGSSIGWVAVHREHHRFVDQDKDPHSPKHKGFIQVQFFSMLYKPNLKYVPDLLRSKFHVMVHKYYWAIHFAYALILFVSLGPFSIVYAYLFPSCLLWNFGSLVNNLGHYNVKKKEVTPTNNWLLGILVWGEGFHKNHHDNVKSPSLSVNALQFDIGYFFIKRFLSR